jgi:ParB-like chromosome segregation protein Spo0J
MLIHVPLNQIDDNPFQRRQDYGDVESLAADIAANGLLQTPIGRLLFDGQPQTELQTYRVLDANGPGWPAGASFRVQLGFGHRRLRAMRELRSDDPDDDHPARLIAQRDPTPEAPHV